MNSEPQELEILGSSSAAYCIQFVYEPKHHIEQYTSVLRYKKDHQANRWCDKIERVKMAFTESHRPRLEARKRYFPLLWGESLAWYPLWSTWRSVHIWMVVTVQTQPNLNYVLETEK